MISRIPRGRARSLVGLMLCSLLLAPGAGARAEEATLRIVVGFAPGGSLDVLGRLLAERMREKLGRPVIVENRVGAGGIVANVAVQSAEPDGRTVVLVTSGTMITYPFVYDELPYDPERDFAPVAQLVEFPIAVGIAGGVPASTLSEFAALVKRDDRFGFCGSSAPGSLSHFFCLEFARTAGIELMHVAYKGGAPLGLALLSGEVSIGFSTPLDMAAAARDGKARFAAVSTAVRSPQFPDIPTLRELGYDIEGSGWYALYAPAATPPALVERIGAAAIAAVKDPALAERLRGLGLDPTGCDGAALRQIMQRDSARWGPVVKASGFKATE